MPLGNTHRNYGTLTKTLHWLTALLIFTALPLGYLAQQAPLANGEEIAHKAWLFSLHKTAGISAFFIAALRILWAFSQTRPGLINSENRIEAVAAHTVHWLLYGSMLLVPLSGWLHHASTTGFAPILWPFSQSLAFIPKSEGLADLTSSLHFLFLLVLAFSILAHMAGALKHLVIDRDQTVQRMLPGAHSAPAPAIELPSKAPLAIAVSIWSLTLIIGLGVGLSSHGNHSHDSHDNATLQALPSDWQVTDGQLTISVHQFGADVQGQFTEWTAGIQFEETATDGQHGNVTAEVAISSLTLGSVTVQALGADFVNADQFPTAKFVADLFATGAAFVAKGDLTLRGVSIPVEMPFALSIIDSTATMSGTLLLDRRDFLIGASMADESSLSFPVEVQVSLTATRTP